MHLEINGITKRFGRTVALDDVSFALTEPGIHGFVGPNGAGKTTLLRILAGFDEADSGDAVIDGVSRIEYPEQFRRRIGFMPDTLPNSRDIVVKEYIDFYARAFCLSGDARKAKIREVCELTRLDGMLDKPLFALSKGMKQRVLLARLLIHDPELMLLDEPAAGLDPRARVELRDALLELARRGKTILLSSHILSELEDMISGLVILEQGKLVSAGKFGASAADAAELPPQEELIISAGPGADLETYWVPRLCAIPGVEQCIVAPGGRRLKLLLTRGAFEQVLPEIVRIGFPIAVLRRPELAPDLEKIFLTRTTGGVQ